MSGSTCLWLWASAPVLSQLPGWYVYGFTFLFGAIVGSFLNVCILRIPEEGVSIFFPRNSRCPVCEYEIRWYDNIPILSWLLLRGRCRSCKTPISLQYPLVELMTAVMALAVVKHFGLQPVSLVWFALICSLIVITFIDMAYWIIPDVITLPALVLGVVLAALLGPPALPSWQDAAFGALFGGGLFLLISYGYTWLRKREGMGMGDAKLLGMLGAFFGWKMLPLVILLASAQGLVAAFLLYALGWREGVPEDFYEEEDPTPQEETELAEESTVQVELEASDETERAEEFEVSDETELAEEFEVSGETERAEGVEVVLSEVEEQDIAEREVGKDETIAAPGEWSEGESDSGFEEEEEELGLRGVAIPFGPFLSLAAIEVLFWGERIYVWLAQTLRF